MKILMVCLGNICRSPMAQGILEHKADRENLGLIVDSAGTSDYHIGEAPDHRAQKKCLEYGIDISNYRGRQFEKEDFNRFDQIFAMDEENYDNILELAETTEDRNKVELILNLSQSNKNLSVPDPYFGGEDGFEHVYQLIDAACMVLIEAVKEGERS